MPRDYMFGLNALIPSMHHYGAVNKKTNVLFS